MSIVICSTATVSSSFRILKRFGETNQLRLYFCLVVTHILSDCWFDMKQVSSVRNERSLHSGSHIAEPRGIYCYYFLVLSERE